MLTREICKQCGEVVRVGFHVPDKLWEIVAGNQQVLCLDCFTRKADEMMLRWNEEIEFFPVTQIEHTDSRVSRLLSDGAEKFIDFVLMQENAGVSITKDGRRKKAWIGGVESTDEDIVRFVENYIRAVR